MQVLLSLVSSFRPLPLTPASKPSGRNEVTSAPTAEHGGQILEPCEPRSTVHSEVFLPPVELPAVVDWLKPAAHVCFHVGVNMNFHGRILEVSYSICRLWGSIVELRCEGFDRGDTLQFAPYEHRPRANAKHRFLLNIRYDQRFGEEFVLTLG